MKTPEHISEETSADTGFIVRVTLHTDEVRKSLLSPERLRFILGAALDKYGISEEVDYTLEVNRTYGATISRGGGFGY